ncbi:hypothetical protein PILCRDRAFT_824474 [Piloderma croceum F 1598]|uniref:Uncharacterized protein n=1 Tax=Piloderma croceum (strain F 1598) TaxID=765440 RepID=A0A0C3F0D9_PILCF|nr:hypothetical protein PILCRDRAFT_826614 [Piloderma croceum F 1598]KIM78255.1 hypothetical protein PILCRDRAFT_824474 [Piloderma croceum F 1598]
MPPVTRSQAGKVQTTIHAVDLSGSPIKVGPSATGQGTRTVWVYLDVAETESTKPAAASVSLWPTLSTLSSLTESVESDRPQTPEPRASWTAGSVIATPTRLQRSPGHIGGHGIDFWRDGSGVIVRDIVDGAGVSQSSHHNGEVAMGDTQSGGNCQNYMMQQMRELMERRNAELAVWKAAQSEEYEPMGDADVFKNTAPRLGPEGTILIEENTSSQRDTQTDNAELAELQHRQNLQAWALGLEPTIIIHPGQYEPPRRTLPGWNRRERQALRSLALEPTELVL